MVELSNLLKRKFTSHRLMVLGDFNEGVNEYGKHSLKGFMEDNDLKTIMDNEEVLPSVRGSNRTIDHILTRGIDLAAITRKGQLPHDMGFSDSDHRGMYVDINAEMILGHGMEEPQQRPRRRLVSENKVIRDQYLKDLAQKLVRQL